MAQRRAARLVARVLFVGRAKVRVSDAGVYARRMAVRSRHRQIQRKAADIARVSDSIARPPARQSRSVQISQLLC